jgi:hypothetical protein
MACSQSWPRPFARPGHEATRLSTPLTTQSRRACPACPGVPWELVEGDG